MKFHSYLLLALLSTALLTSCQDECEPVDVDALNSIYLQFDTSGEANSFSPAELDSLYFIRYEVAELDSFLFPVDTFNVYDYGFYASDYRLRMGREHPIGVPSGAPYYTEFMYKFMSRDQDFEVRLQQIEIEGSYVDDCTYEPRLKRYVLNDDTITVTGSTAFIPVFKN